MRKWREKQRLPTTVEEWERMVTDGIAEAAEWIEAAETTSAGSAPFSAFSDSTLGRWLHQRLSAEPEQADVVHDRCRILGVQELGDRLTHVADGR